MLYLFSIWCILAIVVLSLAGYRSLVDRSEDDLVHLGDADTPTIKHQSTVASRLEFIDTWGKKLTIVTGSFGLILGAIYLYSGWIEATQLKP